MTFSVGGLLPVGRRLAPSCAAALLAASVAHGQGITDAPRQDRIPLAAQEAGYLLNTVHTSTFSASNVDVDGSLAGGFQWYRGNNAASVLTFSGDGSMTITVPSPDPGYNSVASAVAIPTPPYFVGTAIGGGAYIEFAISFDAASVVDPWTNGWPAVWTIALDNLFAQAGLPNAAQWPQVAGEPVPGYLQFIEPDVFEFFYSNPSYYHAAVRDWYGVWNVTCPGFLCATDEPWADNPKVVPADTDWSKCNRVGMLWKIATASKPGEISFWFNDKQMGPATKYVQFVNQAPPPTSLNTTLTPTPWTFGAIDQERLVLLLSTGKGVPLHVCAAKVWQLSDVDNLKNNE